MAPGLLLRASSVAGACSRSGRQEVSACGRRAPSRPGRRQVREGLRRPVVARATVYEWEREGGDDGGALSGIADKVKTETPLIGLLTKLLSPQGVTKGQLTYQEFSRAIYDNVPSSFHIACENTEKRFGEMAGIRGCLYCLWVACFGAGILTDKEMSQACQKLRQNGDLAYFIELFEFQRDEGVKVRDKLREKPPAATQEDKIAAAVANLAEIMGGAEGLGAETEADLFEIVRGAFPSSEDGVRRIVAGLFQS